MPKLPSSRKPLTRQGIAEAALREIDARGLERLSMRALGARLGVEAMAIYHHFSGKGALLDAVMELLLDEAELPPAGSAPPLARFRRFIESYREIAVRHPHAFVLLATRRFNTERLFGVYEQILGMLAEAGFEPPEAARYFRLAGYFVGGAGMADIASRMMERDATPLKLERFDDRANYPRVAAVAPYLRVSNLDAVFKFGLDVIMQAMESAVRAARSARASGGGGRSSGRPRR